MKKFDHSKKTLFEACWPDETARSSDDIARVFSKTDNDNVYRFASYTITVIGRILGINDFFRDDVPVSKICEEVENYVAHKINVELLKKAIPYLYKSDLLLLNASLPNKSDDTFALLMFQNRKLNHNLNNLREICFGTTDKVDIDKELKEDPAMLLSYILSIDSSRYGTIPFIGEMFGYVLQSLTGKRSVLIELLYSFLKDFDKDVILNLIKMLYEFDVQLEQQCMEDKDSTILQ